MENESSANCYLQEGSELRMCKQEHKGKAEAVQERLWGPNASQTGPGAAGDVGVDDDDISPGLPGDLLSATPPRDLGRSILCS